MSHRSWRTRLILVALAVLTLVTAAATGVSAYVLVQLGRIERHELAGVLTPAPQQPVTAADVLIGQSAAVAAKTDSAAGADSASSDEAGIAGDGVVSGDGSDSLSDPSRAADPPAGQPVLPSGPTGENYLLVGTDSTLGLAADDPLRAGHSDHNRLADVIMVIRLRDDGTAAMMSIPRDLAAEIAGTSDIAGTGVIAKINSAYNRDRTTAGRAARMIDTVEENLDITLQHFVEVDFEAFLRLVDAIGGVEMTFDRPLRDEPKEDATDPTDSRSGFVTGAGTHLLDGRQALAFVRSRHLEAQLPDGTWQRHGAWNDLARTDRQRAFLRTAVAQVAPALLANPIRLLAVLDIAADHLSTSDTLSVVNDGRRLAGRFVGVDVGADVEDYELRVVDIHDPVRWSLGLDPQRAEHNQRVLDVFRGIGWDDIVESRVRVQVTGTARHQVAAGLSELGFDAEAAGPMPDGISGVPEGTVVYLAPQGRLAAGLLASHLLPVPEFAGHAELDATTVILHIGDEPLRIDPGYRRVDVPSADQLAP
ncbi:LCP family protein [Candidatus Poriferisodalis sp.]|uniref:LCP family protein n=1 Tax=Candidatus Poriferisodalis sp. TaxID=3101277 RepID=UPI003B5AC6FE